MSTRAILTSRFFVVPAIAIATLIAWNLYVAAHAHGEVSGKVVRADGAPARGATVILYERNLTSHFLEKTRTTTDAAGEFRFKDNRSHQIRLDTIGPDGRQGQPRILRLWFAAQDVDLRRPLVVSPSKN
ncbi:MAG: carboxypeptidase regulatory-like domain-containing protein [Hyphomicrobiales bacterium]|nr:carboxypeptidase regulatory-like domain-containing protein [Hyphomicrobiales bacterium]MBV9052380.1 carboxypeptidase regulatory-like domain-containing protein [Hyphomicrobiales bacterium]MBV9137791.1 carboxypeptidase regulatory-like domain-containing protein [Hyphomicrobiales bacterium]MBV9974769.1 carboxypeptidase regulatory-like domain-containing protein [Hyphomicrobiales bacterium]